MAKAKNITAKTAPVTGAVDAVAKIAEDTTSKEVKKETRNVFIDDRGLKFRFKTTAPKTLNIDGKSRLVTELIDEAEVMLELVHGNNSFIENIQ